MDADVDVDVNGDLGIRTSNGTLVLFAWPTTVSPATHHITTQHTARARFAARTIAKNGLRQNSHRVGVCFSTFHTIPNQIDASRFVSSSFVCPI
eukprot:jgi/Psemu1/306826/fgenesh1_kg.284_\